MMAKKDRSARSRRSIKKGVAVAAAKRGAARKAPPHEMRKAGLPLLGQPVRPMLATLVAEAFDRQDWLFEVKWDGYRAIAEIADANVKLYSRNLLSFEKKFAPVLASLAELGHDAVLDGEIVALDGEGKSRFQLLQNYQKTGMGTLVYYVFDLLYLDGEDLRAAPLRRRKELLAPLLQGWDNVRFSEHVEEHGIPFFEAAVDQDLDGIMAKDAASPYREGTRSPAWLKVKTRKRQEVVIGGFTEPRGSRQGLGSLVLGVFEGNELVYVGHAGGGFNDKSLADMRARLEPLIQKVSPFQIRPKTNAPVHWVKPVLICEVAFQEWTEDGSMRQPIFLGLREDKPARSVKRELPAPLPEAKPSANKRRARRP
jgi:bifunctional non-homologous end joining protein LigD